MLGIGSCFYFDIHKNLYEADITKLSFLILIIFGCTSVWIGTMTYRVGVLEDYDQRSEVGWFISESCPCSWNGGNCYWFSDNVRNSICKRRCIECGNITTSTI